ncbi:trimethyllysine dioxygenase, mitochondrial-like [Actinia tenebrosa]|uniref:Trimethyllysine dioxygenase, mitochondrial n=1 Tax=Actinia tenebrosa TaxID=6105 RepID=A0A6P8ITL6_ACTTE|nr:trimethyllysine dioxygenase, mitochondrial-like [Actinia tenebrosa]
MHTLKRFSAPLGVILRSARGLRIADKKGNWHLGLRRFSFCSSDTSFNPITSALLENDKIKVQWQNGQHSELHNVWLRDHCNCAKCLNQETFQRELDLLEIPLDIKPSSVTTTGDILELKWSDNHVTVFNSDWLIEHAYKPGMATRVEDWVEPVLWDGSIISSVKLPNITFESVLQNEKERCRVSNLIEKYGFAFVHETPTDVSSIEKLSNALAGFVRETNYGRLWEFSNEVMDHADTAYTAQHLEAHTDNTYFTDPAGLQLLHCTFHDGKGGESLLVDGFHAAEVLKQTNLEAFEFLSSHEIPFHFKDDKIQFKANGHVIELDPFTNEVARIRFNMYDRDILNCLPAEDVTKFYGAFKAFASVIRNPENEYWFKLTPGKCLVMGNWRVMHGRSGFTGLRKMQGCYINRDDFRSHFRPKYQIYKNQLD